MSIVSVKNLNKSFKRGFIPKSFPVLKDISFDIEPGCITGFLGANGSGKTTTIKSVLQLIRIDSGSISYFNGSQSFLNAKKNIGYLPEHPYFYDYLTGAEFLKFYGKLSGMSIKDIRTRSKELLRRVDLLDAEHKALRSYSKGMLQKIGLAQALLHNPQLVILDEPLSGLDPDGRQMMSSLIKDIAKEGVSVFFSSHLLYDVEKLCQNLVVLKAGTVCYDGSLENLLQSVSADYEIQTNKSFYSVKSQLEMEQKVQQLIQNDERLLSCHKKRVSLEEIFKGMAL